MPGFYKNDASAPLMAMDDLGRVTPNMENAPLNRSGRLVGVFYFLWLGEQGRHKAYDISKMTAEDPDLGKKPWSDKWGGIGVYHHWGEPLYGYYYSDDEWVVRHHMKLLVQANIDFLFFDTTNALIYEKNAKLVMSVLDEYANDGWKIPKVMFYTNTNSGETVQKLYDAIYKPGFCRQTWFCLEGKPVIIAVPQECSRECRRFFNIKLSQWPNEPDKVGGWPWMDFKRPQRVFTDTHGRPVTMSVSVAQHPQLRFGDSVLYGETKNCGRGYHNGANDPDPDAYKHGYNFAEQFEYAIKEDPPIVLVTGWNEWIAGQWKGIPDRPVMFVDCANYEYSRDIEMMRGGYFDNFYMQLVSYVRKYKGVSPDKIYGDDESAVYYAFADGDVPRYSETGDGVYENRTQRNVLLDCIVEKSKNKLYFILTCKSPITEYDGVGDWMHILINTDGGKDYNYLLNAKPLSKTVTSICKKGENGEWIPVGEADMKIDGDMMTFCVNPDDLQLDGRSFTLWFKFVDSTEKIESMEDLYEKGDAAPLGRLNYVYRYHQ